MLSLGVWQMEPEKTVNKKRMNFHVNSSTTVKRRSKNFYTVQTRTSGEVSAKLLLWWNEKYPFRNAKIVVKNRTSVYGLLTRTFSLKFLHVLTETFYTNARTLREVLPCTFSLWEMREPVGLLTPVYSDSIWRILARSYYAHFMSNIFPKLHFKNTCQNVLNPTLTFTENTLKC